MGSKSKQPVQNSAPISDSVSHPPLDTAELRKALKAFLDQQVKDPISGKQVRLGSYTFGVYVFYDYDGEPIYVGQTREKLSGRVGRHLTNQRTDAVAMSVLDPFEVYEVELYPLPDLEGKKTNDPAVKELLDRLEATVYIKVLENSEFSAVLNEKVPAAQKKAKLPASFRGRIVSDSVIALRSHPDVRIARRAATLARLAQIISERKVAPGLRRVLLVQSERLQSLAKRRFAHFEGLPDDGDDDDSAES
ncbi:MAG: GIY-YIG nuclease family protein [Gemmatimonadaceae bacterium]|nr:GIY-YIG nuclease family protein [Gemmatimonadaceae bacterium]MCW5827580.1 GIY-YIG nuclease family protein [Gemmatimonadaceae bacterium]